MNVPATNVLTIDIGGTKFSAAAFGENARIWRRESRGVSREEGRVQILEELGPIIREWNKEFHFGLCGIGFGGPVIWETQTVATSTHVGGWSNFDFPGWVKERIGPVSVAIDNDANVGGIGEYLYGAGRNEGSTRGVSPLLYVTLSTGIGGGILVEGEVLRGVDSWAGEIGHLNVRPDGPACLCGSNGCLERMCCGLWLERDFGRPAKELIAKPEFVRRYVVDMARGFKAAIMLLNPARIVVGGGISKAGDLLFVPLREELARQMPPWSQARVDVQPAQLADDSVLYGAFGLATRTFPVPRN